MISIRELNGFATTNFYDHYPNKVILSSEAQTESLCIIETQCKCKRDSGFAGMTILEVEFRKVKFDYLTINVLIASFLLEFEREMTYTPLAQPLASHSILYAPAGYIPSAKVITFRPCVL